MSVSARVRAPVSYRAWLALVQAEFVHPEDWSYATQWYSFKAAWEQAMSPHEAAMDCKRWLYG